MALVTTKTKIISQVSLLLGNGVVDSLNNPNNFVKTASEAYDLILPSLLSSNNWRFATDIRQLSKLVDKPEIQRWSVVYLLPSDYVAMVRTYPQVPYQIYNDKLFTNVQEMFAEFRIEPDPSQFPSYFVSLLTYELAEHLALSEAQREDLAAFISKKKIEKMATANWVDHQSHPVDNLSDFPFITSRFNGTTNDDETISVS